MPFVYDLQLDKVVGCGVSRSVWKTPDGRAVKLAHRFDNGAANRIEWVIWHHAEPELKKILVPPISIHENGIYMVVTLGDPIRKNEVPKNIPPYLTDVKTANWVRIAGRVLLADYAQFGVLTHLGLDPVKLRDYTIPVEELCKK